MPAISVIVPVYKVEPYLRPCLDSILAQTFQDFELILVDDGSPDNCGAICDEYSAKDSRVHVIHQENGGLSAARNAGIDWAFANSDSKWITFVDSDDLLRLDSLFYLYQAAAEQKAEIAVCLMSEFPEDEVPGPAPGTGPTRLITGHEAVLNLYSDQPKIYVSACCKLYKKANLFDGIRFPVGKLHEDQAVTPIILSRAASVAVVDRSLYCYRLRGDSIMHTDFSIKRYDDIYGVEQCINYFHCSRAPELEEAASRRRTEMICVFSLLARKNGIYAEVPQEYRIGKLRALRWLIMNLSDDRYSYQLAKIHPKQIRPHVYWRKLKKTLHIPCN